MFAMFDCCCDEKIEEPEVLMCHAAFSSVSHGNELGKQHLGCDQPVDGPDMRHLQDASSIFSTHQGHKGSGGDACLVGRGSFNTPARHSRPVDPRRIDVVIPRQGRLGFAMEEKVGVGLVCTSIAEDGCMHSYNLSAPPGRSVEPHDIILYVNDMTTSVGIMSELLSTTAGVLRIGLLRPITFDAHLDKGSGGLGAEIAYQKEGRSIEIKGISEGAVARYNSTAPEDKVIRVGDWIQKVNGISDTAEGLVKLVSSTGSCTLTMIRRP